MRTRGGGLEGERNLRSGVEGEVLDKRRLGASETHGEDDGITFDHLLGALDFGERRASLVVPGHLRGHIAGREGAGRRVSKSGRCIGRTVTHARERGRGGKEGVRKRRVAP